MSSTVPEPVRIVVSDDVRVSGLLQTPPGGRACYVFAHGAGAGMDHPFMAGVARELALRGVATLRYQFPYMERGAGRPDPPQQAQATVRAAVAAALDLLPGLPLIAGGKSFGGRIHRKPRRKLRYTAYLDWHSSAFRFIRPVGHRRTAPYICLKSRSRCCFCKVPAIH